MWKYCTEASKTNKWLNNMYISIEKSEGMKEGDKSGRNIYSR